MSDRLTEIEERLKAATPGPWEVDEIPETGECRLIHFIDRDGDNPYESEPITAGWTTRRDADFMASAPADVAFLLARVRELEAELENAELREAWHEH